MKFPCGESFQIEIVTSMVSLFREWDALTRMHKSFLFRDILAPFRPQVFELANGVIPNDASSDLAGKVSRKDHFLLQPVHLLDSSLNIGLPRALEVVSKIFLSISLELLNLII